MDRKLRSLNRRLLTKISAHVSSFDWASAILGAVVATVITFAGTYIYESAFKSEAEPQFSLLPIEHATSIGAKHILSVNTYPHQYENFSCKVRFDSAGQLANIKYDAKCRRIEIDIPLKPLQNQNGEPLPPDQYVRMLVEVDIVDSDGQFFVRLSNVFDIGNRVEAYLNVTPPLLENGQQIDLSVTISDQPAPEWARCKWRSDYFHISPKKKDSCDAHANATLVSYQRKELQEAGETWGDIVVEVTDVFNRQIAWVSKSISIVAEQP